MRGSIQRRYGKAGWIFQRFGGKSIRFEKNLGRQEHLLDLLDVSFPDGPWRSMMRNCLVHYYVLYTLCFIFCVFMHLTLFENVSWHRTISHPPRNYQSLFRQSTSSSAARNLLRDQGDSSGKSLHGTSPRLFDGTHVLWQSNCLGIKAGWGYIADTWNECCVFSLPLGIYLIGLTRTRSSIQLTFMYLDRQFPLCNKVGVTSWMPWHAGVPGWKHTESRMKCGATFPPPRYLCSCRDSVALVTA